LTPFRVTNHVTPRRLRTELKIKPLPRAPSPTNPRFTPRPSLVRWSA
jgi:hypothetical protein